MAVRVLVASRNAKKLRELQRVLDAAGIAGIDLVGLDAVPPYPEAPETGATFEENAAAKARDGALATGMPCVADDSGLEIDALRGMPGVLSARWSGRHGDDDANTALVLAQLDDVPDERRGAAFVSACALAVPAGDDVTLTVVRGEWRGTIAREPHGSNGFGYDPIFRPEEEDRTAAGGEGRTAAELSADEKDAASHRGRALAQLVPSIAALARG